MRAILRVAFLAAFAAVAMAGCSSASSSSAATDGSAAVGDIPVYPGATAEAAPFMPSSPSPDGRSYSTQDSVADVTAWYKTKAPNTVFERDLNAGAVFLVGDRKAGSVVMVVAKGGKTWIVSGPAAMFGKIIRSVRP
jgi:hypothetical protein